MADLLDSTRRELRERLAELRPLVSEYERLDEAERALTSSARDRQSRDGVRRRHPRQRDRRERSRPAASSTRQSAANREALLAVIGERPGVTKAELKESTGVSSAGVAQSLRRLLGRGEVRQESPPGGDIGYRLGETHAQ